MAARDADVTSDATAVSAGLRGSGAPERPLDEVGGSASLQGYRHLAMRVIDQALRDLAGPGCTAGDRATARAFLDGSPMLHLWCAVADVGALGMVTRIRPAHERRGAHVSPGSRPCVRDFPVARLTCRVASGMSPASLVPQRVDR